MSYIQTKNNQNYLRSPCNCNKLQEYIDYSLYPINPYKRNGGGNNQNFSLQDPSNPSSYISHMVKVKTKEKFCGRGTNHNLSLQDPQNLASYNSIITENYCTGNNKVLSLQDPNNLDSYNAYYTKNVEYFEIPKKGIFVLFYADWCHYCRKYMPIWEDIKQKNENKYNFVKIREKEIPSRILNDEKISNKIKESSLNINGFPTVIFIYQDKDNLLKSYVVQDRNKIIKEIEEFL